MVDSYGTNVLILYLPFLSNFILPFASTLKPSLRKNFTCLASAAKYSLAGCQDATHGMFAGGYASYMHGNIEQLNMSNDNINSSFGSLSAGARYRHDATSGSS